MKRALLIAKAELLLMARSKIALIGFLSLLLLSVIAAATSSAHMANERQGRVSNQTQTDALFKAQPARHPHRMVHYGSYVYRPVGMLAGFDPGVDPFSGTVLYLEGHRQNSAVISSARESSSLMRFGQLTPAFVLQTLAPLLLVFLGFNMVVRERLRGSLRLLLSSGVSGGEIVLGKGLALCILALASLTPSLIALIFIAIGQPSETSATFLIGSGYTLYLLVWAIAITAVSAWVKSGQAGLMILVSIWTFVAIIAPRSAAELASKSEVLPSRAVTDLTIQAELRLLGDSHNPNDPYFAAFKARTLARYNVTKVEDLPFNFRGALSAEGEALTAKLFDQHFDALANTQRKQVAVVKLLSFISPAIAVRRLSMVGAGTDLETHLRFLEQGEKYRFSMVQKLNAMHKDKLTLADDAARSKDPEAERRTRLNGTNWAQVPDFVFAPTSTQERRNGAIMPLTILAVWLALVAGLATLSARRLGERAL